MRIGIIQGSSQAGKNELIFDTVKKYAPKDAEVINFGCTLEEQEKYSYIDVSVLVGILLASGAVDFVVTGCSSGQGMMLACNSMPGVICGYAPTPKDAYLFAQINNGNAISLPLGEDYTWTGEDNFEKTIEALFSEPFGQGYPKSEAERKRKDTEKLKEIRRKSQIQFEDLLGSLDTSIIEKINKKNDVIKYAGKSMLEKIYLTEKGPIHYWISSAASDGPSLVFLPGLSADHRLFEKQTDCFNGRYRLFVWDAPGHASSYPFQMDFTLADKAIWLNEILEREDMSDRIIIGQSMGGYVGQMYAQLYPEKLRGFISIDSAPLQRQYLTGIELWLLKRMEPVYRHYPWKMLLKQGTNGVAVSEYGRSLMHSMMMTYDGDQKRYAELAGHGYRILAEAIEEDLPYEIKCPALLICGDKDHAGSCIRYNKKWHKISGIKIEWIKGAGHNSNTDEPEQINKLIDSFVNKMKK